jgi:hypothetical protein
LLLSFLAESKQNETMSQAEDRTFAIIATKDIRADDIDIKAGEQVACVTGQVSVLTLFGLIQFHGFSVEEVTAEYEADTEEVQPVEQVAEETSTLADTEPEASPSVVDEPAADQPGEETVTTTAIDLFVADGLDEKTAKILVEQNELDPTKLKELIAEGFDLLDLDGIGETRAVKILAVYPKPA